MVIAMVGDGRVRDRPARRTLFGQPVGLANLFGIELWERFAFYGMLTILGYYLYYSVGVGGLGLPKSTAAGIVGAYGGFVYLSTVLGGWVSDRLLGTERTVFYGGVAVMAGHAALAALPGLTGVGTGLLLIALGSGALKSSASSLLGALYDEGDPRRDAGFTLFYLGVNLGAFLGPLLTGLMQISLGFRWAFGAAALAMAVGLVQYAVFRRTLAGRGRQAPNPLPRSGLAVLAVGLLAAAAVVALASGSGILTVDDISEVTSGLILAASIGYFAVMLNSPKVNQVERRRVAAFIPLFAANVVFMSLFQQVSTVLAIYADERINRSVLGWVAPPEWIAAIEPVWVIALSPLFAVLWTRLGTAAPTTPQKFGCGVIGMGLAFLLLLVMAGTSGQSVPVLFVVAVLAVFAVSELILAPTGLAAASQLAPRVLQTQMMALYLLSFGLGTALSGVLARVDDPAREFAYFGALGVVALVTGVVVLAIAPRISDLMDGVH